MSKNSAIVQTLSKGLQLLEFLAEKKSTTVTVLAKEMDLQKSASYRFLNTLRLHGYIEQDSSNNYILTDKLAKLGKGIVPKLEFYDITRRILEGLIKNYPQNETIGNLGFWKGSEIIYLVQSSNGKYTPFHEGITVPAYCTALGKAILAYFNEDELNSYLEQVKFTGFTENTIVSPDALKKELEQIRKQGYAVMADELCLGLKGIGIPLIQKNAPVRYAVSVTQTLYEDVNILVSNFKPLLQNVADEVLSYIDLGIFNTTKNS